MFRSWPAFLTFLLSGVMEGRLEAPPPPPPPPPRYFLARRRVFVGLFELLFRLSFDITFTFRHFDIYLRDSIC